MIYYTADTHIRDQRVFDKCAKPFADLTEYANEIVRRWNAKVQPTDTVYVLGDIAEDTTADAIELFRSLNGTKHLIVGNHDAQLLPAIRASGIFASIDFIRVIEDSKRKVCLCHYPLMDWMEFNRGGYHVYGHVHNKTPLNGEAYAQIKVYYADKPAFNASVDVTGYEPVTLDEMIALKNKNKDLPIIN